MNSTRLQYPAKLYLSNALNMFQALLNKLQTQEEMLSGLKSYIDTMGSHYDARFAQFEGLVQDEIKDFMEVNDERLKV